MSPSPAPSGAAPVVVPVVVIDVVGLTPDLLPHMPRLSAFARDGWQAPLGTVLPAVTCSAQSTFLTGAPPTEHGVVGNGWFFRELSEVFLWRQSNRLVGGDKVWDAARRLLGTAERPITCANLFWWYAMGASTDVCVTPRPVYHADGRKGPGVYTRPAALGGELARRLGEFPLFDFWGPRAGLPSSKWIQSASPTRLLIRPTHHDRASHFANTRAPTANTGVGRRTPRLWSVRRMVRWRFGGTCTLGREGPIS